MKKIERVRSRLNKAISSGYSMDVILSISRQLDNLIVEKMKSQKNKKFRIKGQ
ncbi:MAG: aspartyl-phosphate phosphatase Spo0E family protein [Clostridiaceae bacterium]|nr:aspartyl-phosphate phosphatase Spo0E family protein [Clostridiaceae bacterium]